MTTLGNNSFYAQLSHILGLDKHLISAESTFSSPLDSEGALSGLFKAYVGGIYKELGMERYTELYSWFCPLMEPYALDFYSEMEGENSPIPSSSRAKLTLVDKGTSQQQLQTLGGSTKLQTHLEEEDILTGDASKFTMKLHEYVARYRLTQPEFKFVKSGPDHASEWVCILKLGGRPIMGPSVTSKSDAKHLACRRAMAVVTQQARE